MANPTRETLARFLEEMDGHAWEPAEIEELVAPKHGIITGFTELLGELRKIRRLALPGLYAGGGAEPHDG